MATNLFSHPTKPKTNVVIFITMFSPVSCLSPWELEKQFIFFPAIHVTICEKQFTANANGKQNTMLLRTIAIQRLGIWEKTVLSVYMSSVKM